MVTREELQLRLLAITAAFWIILILIGIPFTIVEIRFSYLFSVVSPERQKWKEDINIVFMALIATFVFFFLQRKKKKTMIEKQEDYILDKRWFTLLI
ncbi:hypothetical protein KM1_174080 [Entamoeba histolytica HM-3:IMSS]|uniref:Uncharacterized protein n=1 Tax=Entamoeba histolytica HM-3:IMSS TaxID=885315 RepID=M7WGA9_ENTHI|nr:hypothetical protein KM1_174080 [Entamoeba histolytica HM-3:IMSS]